MKRLPIIALALGIIACRVNVPITATVTPEVTAQPTATATIAAVRPERLFQRVTPTARPLHQCAVSAEVLTVRTCGKVECAAIGWLHQGEVITTSSTITGWVWMGQGWINSAFCKEIK